MPYDLCSFSFGFQTERELSILFFFFFALKQLEVICFSDNSDGFNSLTALRNTRGEYNKVYNVTCVSEVEPAVLCKSSLPGKHFGK